MMALDNANLMMHLAVCCSVSCACEGVVCERRSEHTARVLLLVRCADSSCALLQKDKQNTYCFLKTRHVRRRHGETKRDKPLRDTSCNAVGNVLLVKSLHSVV